MGVNKVIYYGEVLVDMSQVTVTPESLEKGKTALDAKGELITGLHECEETEPNLQEKTVTPTTALQTVNPDSGYDGLSKVTVNAMPAATQATPSISVSSAGKITASSTQTAGYVAAGTKSATKQLTVQAAKTVTPTTSNQTAVASGRYTTGAVTVKGDANLVPANIKSGVSIFGVAGSASTSEDLTSEITEYASLNAELESVIDSLPNAGGGGANLETCTVTISKNNDATAFYDLYYTTIIDGQIACGNIDLPSNSATASILKGSCFIISAPSSAYKVGLSSGIECVHVASVSNAYRVLPTAGNEETITFTYNTGGGYDGY